MNRNDSRPEGRYRERWITPVLQELSAENRVVVLTGARQVGKSTLLRHADPFREWRYRSFDDFEALRQAEENPASLWAGADEVVLDEVQKAPGVLSAVKLAVDRRPARQRFVLSGSANLLRMQQVGESLAGRAAYPSWSFSRSARASSSISRSWAGTRGCPSRPSTAT